VDGAGASRVAGIYVGFELRTGVVRGDARGREVRGMVGAWKFILFRV
jgi:hypothetical protein